ncbi:hypothetical protein DFH94DRAFT_488499 [Russula ochroleuca]|jgi:hypothetical protein|uniref:Uncharacterized protein n=1 Tax=Russula ochroleuca TaxID=152965 RepID=A0A9P5MVH1_9AGAM|nr:hypothetical protein DFH94DRAFT_85889 [Russula ochroleuca]KAF8479576.1 hypothetical protein DFH94DRAFT_488499 [Russula ochroleuca]
MVPSNSAFCESNSNTTLSDSPDTVDFDPHTSISSVTVELSYTSDDSPALSPKHTTESELRPAAEVFGFLLEKRRSITMNRELALSAPSPDPNSLTGHVHDGLATPSNAKHSSSLLNDSRPAEVAAWVDTPSTVGSILVDPPHTATILNHTRIPVLHGRLHEGSNTELSTAMAITTRASRIPRERRNLQNPSGRRASTSDTFLSPVSPMEPIKSTLAPAYHNGVLLSATNAANRPHLPPKEDGTLAPVSMQDAHRRSASYGSRRPPIPGIWDAGLDSIRKARVRGLKSDKENIISTFERAGMRMLTSFTSM